MRKTLQISRRLTLVLAAALGALWAAGHAAVAAAGSAPDWAINATAIEACSCPMFCQCYFNTEPAGHHEHGGGKKHFCRFNVAWRINHGHYGATKLDGAKFWKAGDIGDDFSDGQMEWVVLTFDKSLSKAQRQAIENIFPVLFPVKWKSLRTDEGAIDRWEFNDELAVATLDGGKTAEVRLQRRAASANGAGPVVIKNLKYWGAPRNDGFVLMPNEVEAYRAGPNAFDYRSTNGFMITVDMNSQDVQPAAKAK